MLHIVRSTRISREIKDVNEIRDYQDISAAACLEIASHPHGRPDYRFLKVETIDIVTVTCIEKRCFRWSHTKKDLAVSHYVE